MESQTNAYQILLFMVFLTMLVGCAALAAKLGEIEEEIKNERLETQSRLKSLDWQLAGLRAEHALCVRDAH